ncbi:MAG: hypothetical protein ACYDDT_11645 [Sulfuricella sp.]
MGGKTFAVYNADHHHSFRDLVVPRVEDRVLWISDLAFNNRSTFMGDGHSGAAVGRGRNWKARCGNPLLRIGTQLLYHENHKKCRFHWPRDGTRSLFW